MSIELSENEQENEWVFPSPSDTEKMSDQELVDKLEFLGFKMNRSILEELTKQHISVQSLSKKFEAEFEKREDEQPSCDPSESDWIWLCLMELWRRWFPEEPCLEFWQDREFELETKILDPEQKVTLEVYLNGVLDLWSYLKTLMDKSGLTIKELENGFEKDLFTNWLSFAISDMWKAARSDSSWQTENTRLCEEVLERSGLGLNDDFHQEVYLLLAQSKLSNGDQETAERMINELLDADPQCGEAYLSLIAMNLDSDKKSAWLKPTKKGCEILKRALSTRGLREKDRIFAFCREHLGIGRKDPCICQSGKRFKGCCGR